MGKAPISFASRSSFDRSRPQMATRAPREINSRAVSNPIPELPPVTRAFADATFMCGFYFVNDFCTLTPQGGVMPEKETLERARQDKAEGKAPSTQAGEFVREEIEHVREGKHGARSTKQAIAIGLSKARRAGGKLPPPEKGTAKAATRRSAARDFRKGQTGGEREPPPAACPAAREAPK